MNIFEEAGFHLKEIVIKEQHNCSATGYWKTNSVKYNFLLLAHEYLFVFKKDRRTKAGYTISSNPVLSDSTGGLYQIDLNVSENSGRQELLSELPEPLCSEITGQKSRIASETAKKLVYEVCKIRPYSASEITIIFDKKGDWARKYINSLLSENKLSLSIPDKPERAQSYYANPGVTKGKKSRSRK